MDDGGELRAAMAEIDDALAMLTAEPANLTACHTHLTSTICHLTEALRKEQGAAECRQLQAKVLRLNRMFRNAEAFYAGWAALAGVTGLDHQRPAISIRG